METVVERLERLETEIVRLMKSIDRRLQINTLITLSTTPLSLPEVMDGFAREALLRETLENMDRKKGKK